MERFCKATYTQKGNQLLSNWEARKSYNLPCTKYLYEWIVKLTLISTVFKHCMKEKSISKVRCCFSISIMQEFFEKLTSKQWGLHFALIIPRTGKGFFWISTYSMRCGLSVLWLLCKCRKCSLRDTMHFCTA